MATGGGDEGSSGSLCVTSRQEPEDTEEMMQWRSISQDGINELWTELSGNPEEEVLEKYKVEEAVTSAYQGRGGPLRWQIVTRENGTNTRSGQRTVGFSRGSLRI